MKPEVKGILLGLESLQNRAVGGELKNAIYEESKCLRQIRVASLAAARGSAELSWPAGRFF